MIDCIAEVSSDGDVRLPQPVLELLGEPAGKAVRFVEADGIVFVVPIDAEVDAEQLAAESASWREAVRHAWSLVPYEPVA